MIQSLNELNDRHIDVLSEVGNIGAGNAAMSLSVLLDESVSISIPRVMIEDYAGVIRAVGDPEAMSVGILVRFDGEVKGMILFLIEFEDAKEVARALTTLEDINERIGLSEMKLSAVREIGNILASSYLGSIATLTGLRFDMSIPYAAIDMAGALIAAPMVEFSVDDTKILFIEESFSMVSRDFRSHVILFADISSLNEILRKLGY
jgi:chemotaxis protein CheC